MLNSWSVTGMAKNHHCFGVVYRDTTQADYEHPNEVCQPASRHTSASSGHLDTGESFFFDELRKPLHDGSSLKEANIQLDDVFLFDLPPGPRGMDMSPAERIYGVSRDKVIQSLERVTGETGVLGQEYSAAAMDMWEQNETFQDLSELIEEGKTLGHTAPSPPCYVVPSDGDEAHHTVPSWDPQPAPPHPPSSLKRPLDPSPCEAGPSNTGPDQSPKLARTEEAPPVKYSEMRVKNNMASRRSRMTRKEKEVEMEKRAAELEQENELLRIKVKNLEEVTDRLKKHLINSIVKK